MRKACAWLAAGVLLLGVNVAWSQELIHAPEAVPEPAAVSAPAPQIVVEPAVSCAECGSACHTSCREHRSIWRWLTYHAHDAGLCECCHKCKPCCEPPLYLFFLCEDCCGGRCGPCNGYYTCGTCACTGEPAHRIYHCHPEKNCHDGACGHP